MSGGREKWVVVNKMGVGGGVDDTTAISTVRLYGGVIH
jgi:hypothetical protein